jgi:3-hydroxypropanoate dehydrogenase
MIGIDLDGINKEFLPGRSGKSILVVNVGHPGENAWFEGLPPLDYVWMTKQV